MKNNSHPSFDTTEAFKKLAFELSDQVRNPVLKSRLRIMRTRFNKNSLTPDAMNKAIEESQLFKVHTPLQWALLESTDFTDASIYNREAPHAAVERNAKFSKPAVRKNVITFSNLAFQKLVALTMPEKLRLLSKKEIEKLMTFPDYIPKK